MNLACFTSFQPTPVTIDSLAHSSEHSIVAEGRSDGSIRILDAASLAVTGSITGSQVRSVRRIQFYKNTLISCGIHGSVTMWDLATLSEIASVESSQGAIWDMTIDGNTLYLATETGCVVVVDLSDADMRISKFWRSSARAGTTPVRALSVCVEGGYLFVGDASGSVRRWSIATGSCDATFVLPSKNESPTLIWSLIALGNGQIASGDSLGAVSVWDVSSCTLVQSRQDHQADILVMHHTGSTLLTSGVDSRVVRYNVTSGDNLTLHFLSVTSVLSRDVSAITTVGDDVLVVGGADAKLGVVSLATPPSFESATMDRFRERIAVGCTRVFCQDGLTKVKIFTAGTPEKESQFVAELDASPSDIASFAVNQDGSRVLLADAAGTVRLLALGSDSIAEDTKVVVNGAISASALNDRFAVVATAGKLVVIENGKTRDIAVKSGIVSRIVIDGSNAILVSGSVLTVASLATSKKPVAPITASLLSPVTAVSAAVVGHIVVATADHGVHCLSSSTLSSVWKSALSNKVSRFNHVNSISVTDSTIFLFGESFIATTEFDSISTRPANKGFRFNSTLPMGGVVVGTGDLGPVSETSGKKRKSSETKEGVKKSVLAVLANYKATSKALIAPFERKAFQK